ncbi:MAG TPA: GNAT family N-acetyltransferase [Phycisphaerae bacterium]|nr:GNAT family N-acetyltransferase [Phycisphaerae bacterium]
MDSENALVIEKLDEANALRPETLRFLLAREGESLSAADRRVRRLLQHVADQPLRIGAVVRAARAASLVSAAMLIESPGRLGSVFVPAGDLSGSQGAATVAALRVLQQHARSTSLTLLQSLLGAEERRQSPVFARAGFELLADLAYLDRPAEAPHPDPAKPPGLEFLPFRSESEPLFVEVLARTYQDSRDCPRLTGVRRTEDVLAAHRASGIHDPNHWLLLKIGGRPVGVLLLAGVPDRNAFEVVYVGVVPEARGRRIGDLLLDRAVDICRRNGNADLTLAVDGNNEPALRLYRRWRFREVSRRQAWIWLNPERPSDAGDLR